MKALLSLSAIILTSICCFGQLNFAESQLEGFQDVLTETKNGNGAAVTVRHSFKIEDYNKSEVSESDLQKIILIHITSCKYQVSNKATWRVDEDKSNLIMFNFEKNEITLITKGWASNSYGVEGDIKVYSVFTIGEDYSLATQRIFAN